MTMPTSSTLSIAIVRQRYNPFGGAERFVERALAVMSQQPLTVTLITRQWNDTQKDPHRKVLVCKPFHMGRLWRDWAFAKAVQHTIRTENFDLIQSHERIAGCDIFRAGDGVHATWLAQRARSLSFVGRLTQWLSPWHRYTLAAEKTMFRDPALRAVICNSEMVRTDIAQHFPQLADKLHVIHNGVDLQRFHPDLRGQHRSIMRGQLGSSAEKPVIIYVGSGFARKGVPQLIEAMLTTPLRKAELWIIGKDKDQKKLEMRTHAYGIEGRVRFLGPQKDVAPYLAAADVFALPTLYDPMPNAALEALACGLPVLTSTSSGAAELINSHNGIVTDALDIPAIAAGLSRLLTDCYDSELSEQIHHAARQSVANFSSENMVNQQIELYKVLLTNSTEVLTL